MKERIAIVDGIRTPFCKAGGVFKEAGADDLAAYVLREMTQRLSLAPSDIDEVILGNVGQPADAANVARVAALKAGIPMEVPAYTVQRNCASGMQALTSATTKILSGEAEIILAGATESMSSAPLLYGKKMSALFTQLMRAKTLKAKLGALLSFRPSFLKPIVGLELGLTDPVCDMIMGSTAELLAREFHITREEQDAFALESHQKAARAIENGRLAEEISAVPTPPKYASMQELDDGPRFEQSLAALAKLRPYFEKVTGTVTAGNSSQITDGAAAALVMRESKAKELGLTPMGYLREFAYAGLEGKRMGLGPVYATSKLLDKSGLTMGDFNLVEINEAFAAQVIANERAFACETFAREHLGRSQALGAFDHGILNVNGGAIALGHPVGATGMRLTLTLLKELKRRGQNLGLATLCIGGGQGAALALEVE